VDRDAGEAAGSAAIGLTGADGAGEHDVLGAAGKAVDEGGRSREVHGLIRARRLTPGHPIACLI
jgi:hypothetical protein